MHNFRSKLSPYHTQHPFTKHKIDLLNSYKIKFNLSKDNLQCFIGDHPKRRLQSKFQTKKSTHSKNKNASVSKRIKGNSEKNIKNKTIRPTTKSPDMILEVSNEILSQIEDKGILCSWKQPTNQQKLINQENNIQKIQSEKEEKQILDLQNKNLWGDCPLALTLQEPHSKSIQSFASTQDYYPYQFSYDYYQPMPSLITHQNTTFQINLEMIVCDPRTTLMIRNVPNKYSIKDISEQIDVQHGNTYDFLYLPYDQKNCCNMGYGFINFINSEYLKQFYLSFNNTRWLKFRSEKICCLTYARLQGLNSLIEHFQNSKVLNQKDKKFRPIIKKFAKIQSLVKEQQYRTCG